MVEPVIRKQFHRNVKHYGLKGNMGWGSSGKHETNGSKSLKTGSLPLTALSHKPQVSTPRNGCFLYALAMLGLEVQREGFEILCFSRKGPKY